MKVNNIYVVVSNGLFKDPNEEAEIDRALEQRVMLKSRRAGYSNMLSRQQLEEALGLVFVEPERERTMTVHTGPAGMQAFNTAITAELMRNEGIETTYNPLLNTQPPTEDYIVGYDPYTEIQDRDSITTTRNMTEQEIINYFDTISNEE